MTLDIGCGSRKAEPDSIGIDVSPDSAADHVWDLDRYPWPLEDARFSRIHMSHVIEHLDDPMRAMAEVYRVAADGADALIVTPPLTSPNPHTHSPHQPTPHTPPPSAPTPPPPPPPTSAPCLPPASNTSPAAISRASPARPFASTSSIVD